MGFLCSGYVINHTTDHSRLACFVILSRITSTVLHVIRSHCNPWVVARHLSSHITNSPIGGTFGEKALVACHAACCSKVSDIR